jgi:hypothetical protein
LHHPTSERKVRAQTARGVAGGERHRCEFIVQIRFVPPAGDDTGVLGPLCERAKTILVRDIHDDEVLRIAEPRLDLVGVVDREEKRSVRDLGHLKSDGEVRTASHIETLR